MNNSLKIVLPALAAFLFLFCGTFNHDLWRPAEAREAAIAKEMLEGGNWVATHLNGRLFLEKPPLYTWAMAVSFKIFGYKPFAARLPVFVFGLLTLIGVFLISSQHYNKEASLWSALMLSSMWLFQEIAHIAMLDNGLLAFITFSMFCLYKIIQQEKSERKYLYGFYIALALAFLCKGAIGVVLITFSIIIFMLISRDVRLFFKMLYLPAIIIFCIIAGGWLIALWMKGGKDYFYVFFVENHLNRALGKAGPGTKDFFYYFPYLLLIGLPWIIFLPAVLWSITLERKDASINLPNNFLRFLAAWFIGMFIALNIAGSKDNQYLAPLLPPLALSCAYWVHNTTQNKILLPLWTRFLSFLLPVIAAIGFAILPLILRIKLQCNFSCIISAIFSFCILLVGVFTFFEFRRFPNSLFWQKFAALLSIAALSLSIFIEPMLNERKSMNYLVEVLKKYDVKKGTLYGYNLGENIDGLLFFYDIPPITLDIKDKSIASKELANPEKRFILVKHEKKDFVITFINNLQSSGWKLLEEMVKNSRPLYLFGNR